MEIKQQFELLFNGLIEKEEKSITYSNNEKINQTLFYYRGFEIIFETNQITTTYCNQPNTFRIHKSLKSLVDEIQEDKQNFVSSFMMF